MSKKTKQVQKLSIKAPKRGSKYKLRKGFQIKGDIQSIADEIESLRGSDSGLKSETVWRAAKNPKSALYREFIWDVGVAAEKHWNEHARYLMRSYNIVTYATDKRVPTPVRCNLSLADTPGDDYGPKTYFSRSAVKRSSIKRRQALREAILHLKAAREKYRELADDLGHIWQAIDALDIDEVLDSL